MITISAFPWKNKTNINVSERLKNPKKYQLNLGSFVHWFLTFWILIHQFANQESYHLSGFFYYTIFYLSIYNIVSSKRYSWNMSKTQVMASQHISKTSYYLKAPCKQIHAALINPLLTDYRHPLIQYTNNILLDGISTYCLLIHVYPHTLQ